jgi:hypothetical protein
MRDGNHKGSLAFVRWSEEAGKKEGRLSISRQVKPPITWLGKDLGSI